MRAPVSRIQIDVSAGPVGCRVLPSTLAEYARERQASAQDRLRFEGVSSANQSSALLLDAAVEATEVARKEMEASVAQTAVHLAVEIAQVLLRKELRERNYDIVAIVRDVLSTTSRSSGGMLLHVNPDDAKDLAGVQFRSGTEVRSDPSVRRGDVQLETDQGLLVRDIDDCLVAIRQELLEAMGS